MRLRDVGATAELLKFMGYQQVDRQAATTRFAIDGNGADFVDLETLATAESARQGAGSVHHLAFAVQDRAAQLRVRKALMETGYNVTPVIDRDYFWAIYFRTPGGVLFEIATHEPGFDRDEDRAHLGQTLKLPRQHAHLRPLLEQYLQPIRDGAMESDLYHHFVRPGALDAPLPLSFHGTGGDEHQLAALVNQTLPAGSFHGAVMQTPVAAPFFLEGRIMSASLG